MSAKYAPKPANKVYTAATGHTMEMAPKWSKFSGWYFVHATAWHSETCTCESYNVSEYAGESE